jgi:hypothetical protein
MAMKITLTNDFHETSVTLDVTPGVALSSSQVRRARKTLCPSYPHCACGGDMPTRGEQPHNDGIELVEYGWDQDNQMCYVPTLMGEQWQRDLEHLRSRGWTWKRIAEACGVDTHSANRWGMGLSTPSNAAKKLLNLAVTNTV